MILALCGGEASDVVAAGAEPAWRRTATLRFERIAGLGGADVAPDEAVALLGRLGFAATARDAAQVTVAVPPWRNDVAARAHPGAEPVAPRSRVAGPWARRLRTWRPWAWRPWARRHRA